MRTLILLPLVVAACASPSQNALDQAMQQCTHGNRYACRQVPGLRAQVAQDNANGQAAGAALGAAIGNAILQGMATPDNSY